MPEPILDTLRWFPAYLPEKGRGHRVSKNGDRKWGMKCPVRTTGVYLIRENGVVVYIGMSMHDIRKRCYRKFERPDSTKSWTGANYRDKLKTHVYEVAYIPCTIREVAHAIEVKAIEYFDPRDNIEHKLQVPESDPEWSRVDEPVPF